MFFAKVACRHGRLPAYDGMTAAKQGEHEGAVADRHLRKAVQNIQELAGMPAAGRCSDRQLLERFASQREETAFATLVDRHGPLVLGVCRRVLQHEQDAEDAFQATFQVLAHKAARVRWHESAASWLYEVAWRVAQKARSHALRRGQHERQAAQAVQPASPAEAAWHELRQVLDEELGNMPRRYRAALVLCYLEGKTRDEAAQELGWSLGALKGRLERGREMLRERLVRRGLCLSAALFALALSDSVVSASVSKPLATATIGSAMTGVMPDAVAALTHGAIQSLFWAKMKVIGSLALAVLVVGFGAGLGLYKSVVNHNQHAALPSGVADNSPGARLPEKLRGHKLLVAFDVWATGREEQAVQRQTTHAKAALAKAGAVGIEQLQPGLFLVDCRGQDPAALLKDLHHRQGALVFHDGHYHASIPFERPHHPDQLLVAAPFACLHFGPGHEAQQELEQARLRFADMPGVVVEKFHAQAGDYPLGHPWRLKLTPGKGTTLLEVFLLTKAGFHYTEKKSPQ